MRLVFFGSGAFGLPTLRRLVAEHEIALVVTQPDRPAGRNRALTPTPIGEFALANGLNVIKTERVNERGVVEQIRGTAADAFVVIAFGQKLGKTLLQDAFAINLHGSLLPKFRGAAPINWAMINGEEETGVSVITVADRMDCGEILAQASTPIDPIETAGELHDRLADLGPAVMLDVLDQFQRSALKPVVQDETQATLAPKLSKADGMVRFDRPAREVRQRVHGLTPWPGCAVKIDGKPIRLHRVQVMDSRIEHGVSGLVLSDFTVACLPGAISILEVQPPGGRVMTFREYRNGQPVKVGGKVEPAKVERA